MDDDEKAKALLTGGMVIKKENIIATGIIKNMDIEYNNVLNQHLSVGVGLNAQPEMRVSLIIDHYTPNTTNIPPRKMALVYLDEQS